MDFVGPCKDKCGEDGWCLEHCHGCHPDMEGECHENCEADCNDCKECLEDRHGDKKGPKGHKGGEGPKKGGEGKGKGGKGKGFLLFKGDDDMKDMPCKDECDPDTVDHDFCKENCEACTECDDEGNCPDECTQACQDECGECAMCMWDAMMDFVGDCMEPCSVGEEEGWCLEHCHGCHPEMEGECHEDCENDCTDCRDCLKKKHGDDKMDKVGK